MFASRPFAFSPPPLLHKLEETAVKALEATARVVTYAPGQLVHSRGDPPGLSIVESGRVSIDVIGADGRLLTVSHLGAGHAFGDHTVFADLSRTHDAHAVEDSRVWQLSRDDALRVADAHPSLRAASLEISLLRGHALLLLLDAHRRLPPAERLGHALLVSGADGDIRMSHEDLAALVGVSRPTIAAALRHLREGGFVELGYRHIRLRDRTALAAWVARHTDP